MSNCGLGSLRIMNDREILRFLNRTYHERTLCSWCRHPSHRLWRRGLCSSCYRLALDFRERPNPALAVAIDFARHEGAVSPSVYPIDPLTIEHLFERIAGAAFRWRRDTD